MKKLFKAHYEAILGRGLITPATTDKDFEEKLIEEVKEWIENPVPQEALDIVNVMTNWLQFKGYDIEKEQLINIEKQINRIKDE